MSEEVSADLGMFLAAIIANQGGVIRVPYDILGQVNGDTHALTVDLESDGAELVFRFIAKEDVPDGLLDV